MNKNNQLIIVFITCLLLIYVIHRNNKYATKKYNNFKNYKREGFNNQNTPSDPSKLIKSNMMNSNPSMMNSNPSMMNSNPSMMNSNPSMMNSNPSMMNSNPNMMNSNPNNQPPIIDPLKSDTQENQQNNLPREVPIGINLNSKPPTVPEVSTNNFKLNNNNENKGEYGDAQLVSNPSNKTFNVYRGPMGPIQEFNSNGKVVSKPVGVMTFNSNGKLENSKNNKLEYKPIDVYSEEDIERILSLDKKNYYKVKKSSLINLLSQYYDADNVEMILKKYEMYEVKNLLKILEDSFNGNMQYNRMINDGKNPTEDLINYEELIKLLKDYYNDIEIFNITKEYNDIHGFNNTMDIPKIFMNSIIGYYYNMNENGNGVDKNEYENYPLLRDEDMDILDEINYVYKKGWSVESKPTNQIKLSNISKNFYDLFKVNDLPQMEYTDDPDIPYQQSDCGVFKLTGASYNSMYGE